MKLRNRSHVALRAPHVAVLLALAVLLVPATAAFAQAGTGSGGSAGRFRLGPLQWTPTFILREAGVDSNVFNAPPRRGETEDRMGTFTSQLDGTLILGIVELSGQASGQAIYFERTTSQRALNGQFNARAEFPIQRFRPSLAVSYANSKERTGNEIDTRARSLIRAASGGMAYRLGTRAAIQLNGRLYQTQYASGEAFRGVSLARALNRNGTSVTGALRLDVSPFTQFVLDVTGSRDTFTFAKERQTDSLRASLGFEFAPDAIVRGRATVGYHKMVPRGTSAFPFAGLTTSIDLSYVLLGRTRIDARLNRDATYSVIESQGYYLSTAGGLEVLHNLVGPVDLILRGSRERLDFARAPDGSAPHLDYADTFGGGLSLRISSSGRISFNYDHTRRLSSLGADFQYERERLFTSATYGF